MSSVIEWQFRCAGLLAQAASSPAGGGGLIDALTGNMMVPLILTMLLMYFLLMRPEQKKRKEMERQLSSLKKNDHVVTIGGICGTVVQSSAESKFVILRVDDSTGTKVKVLRSAISHIGGPDEAELETKPAE